MRTGQLIHHLVIMAAVGLAGCTARLYQGEPKARGDVAVIHVGTTIVRQIDDQRRRGGALDVSSFEVSPGPHRLRLVFELPSRPLGLKILPAQPGIGMCELNVEVRAGRQYYLGARAVGDISDPRWPGTWEAWMRDPAVSEDDDVVARCQAAEVSDEATPTATPEAVAAPAAPGAPAVATPPVAAPAVAAGPTLTAPTGAALRIGAWLLPGLDAATTADLAAIAPAIDAGFDVLTIEPPLDPSRLLGLLGDAWAAERAPAQTALYRRAAVRPCSRSAAISLCLESTAAPAGESRPLLLQLAPAERRR